MKRLRAANAVGPVSAGSLIALITLVAGAASAAPESTIIIEHARVHPGDGRRLDDATVVLRGGTILSITAAGSPSAGEPRESRPSGGARRIDGRGLWITPGLFDAESSTGLVDVTMEKSTVETGLDDKYDVIRAAFQVVDGFNPRAVSIPVTRIEGVTAVLAAPSGGLVSGRGAVLRLAGDRVEDMILRTPVAMFASMTTDGRTAAYGARGGLLLRLRELFDDVRQYARRRGDFERNQMRKVAASRLDLEALIPVVQAVDGARLPLVIEVHRAADIQAALRLAREEKLSLVLSGCEEGWMVAADIAAAKVPVVLSALPNLPRAFEALGARLDNAALLAKAGVKIVISPRGRTEHYSRTIRLEAGNAVAHGLPWEVALAAITRHPAEIFGVSKDLGVLAPNNSADLVVWTGDPFEPLTRPRHVFIAGQEIPLVSRQTLLRDRYRKLDGARPRP